MSQPGAARQPEPPGTPETAGHAEQQQLIQEIGREVLLTLPVGWDTASLTYQAVGTHSELTAHVTAPNGTVIPLAPPAKAATMFDALRHSMYEADRGTWISALYQLQRPSAYSVDFNDDEAPSWRNEPPSSAFAEELRRYPRASGNIPPWLAERASSSEEGSSHSPGFRTAAVFDEAGRPIDDRPIIPDEEREHIIEYLERAPIVLTAHSYDPDYFAPTQPAAVPLTFHTDGSWIWPGAVGYYFRVRGLSPDTDLVRHMRERDFALPDVDERAKELAISAITNEET